jgi:hypothetical protein
MRSFGYWLSRPVPIATGLVALAAGGVAALVSVGVTTLSGPRLPTPPTAVLSPPAVVLAAPAVQPVSPASHRPAGRAHPTKYRVEHRVGHPVVGPAVRRPAVAAAPARAVGVVKKHHHGGHQRHRHHHDADQSVWDD